MTPKQRVKMALDHQEPDRVPHGEFATDYSVIQEALGRPVFWRGKRHYYEALWDGRRDEVVEAMKRDIVEFTLALGVDMVPISAVPHKDFPFQRPLAVADDVWQDERGNLIKFSQATEDIGLLKAGEVVSSSSDFELPEEYDDSELELARYVVEKLGRTHFIFVRPGRFRGLGYTSGWPAQMFLEVADHPEQVAARELAQAEQLHRSIRPFAQLGIDGVALGHDYGYNSGPFVSPATFGRVYRPAMKMRCDVVHDFDLPCLYHSCGNNRLILDQMVAAGMDAYQAIQSVEQIQEVKKLHGNRLTLWGGISTDTLQRGTPGQVAEQALFSIKNCAPGGGFILSSSHSVVVRTPLANYRAIPEACRTRGLYPIAIDHEVREPAWGPA